MCYESWVKAVRRQDWSDLLEVVLAKWAARLPVLFLRLLAFLKVPPVPGISDVAMAVKLNTSVSYKHIREIHAQQLN